MRFHLLIVTFAAAALAQTASDYREAADKLIDAALADEDGYANLSYLCDRIGNRLSGSPGLEKAIAWAAEQMKRDGLENVSTPHVKVPHWSRGSERASIVEPVNRLFHGCRVDIEPARQLGKERQQRRGEVQLGHRLSHHGYATTATSTDEIAGR